MTDKSKKQASQNFYENVYKVVRKIPVGRVSTYGAIARYLGAAKAARMVGYAMNLSHGVYPEVPAHRVVNRNGVLTGKHYFGELNAMQNLLQQEGVPVADDQVQNFDTYFWNPITELSDFSIELLGK